MTPLEIAMIVICGILVGVIVWQFVANYKKMSPEKKNELFDKGILLVNYLKTAWSNDGKIDLNEFSQVLKYLIEILAFVGGISVSAAKVETGTTELLAEQNE